MDETLLVAFAALVLLVAIGIIIYLNPRKKKSAEPSVRGTPQRVAQQDALPRRVQAVRNQRARLRANARQHQNYDPDEEVDEAIDDNVDPIQNDIDTGDLDKLGAKKRAKLEAKAERKAQREIEEQTREDRKRKAEIAEDERRKESEKEAAEEKRKEEEERLLREEQERKDHEEYLKMKAAFSVEEEGYEEGDVKDEENMLQEFVKYIKENKVVILEDLAAHFKLKTQAVIDRIQDLQKDGILTGVIDDRGKYIYISQQELEAVAKFIRQRGRISITELAESSNQLIHLTS